MVDASPAVMPMATERQLHCLSSEAPMVTNELRPQSDARPALVQNEQGAIGYIVAWFLGIPASVLFLIFLVRGCN